MDYFSLFTGEIYKVDLVSVLLTFPTKAKNNVLNLFKEYSVPLNSDNYSGSDICEYWVGNCNYGELPIAQELIDLGIPFNTWWETTQWTDGGNEYYRYTPEGESIVKYVSEKDCHPDLALLKHNIYNHSALIDYINWFDKKTISPSWDNQIEYGKRHRARLLIGA